MGHWPHTEIMDMSFVSPPPLLSIAIAVFISTVWVGPIGLFILRKQLVNATGTRLVAKTVLGALTVLTAPAVAITVLIVIFGMGEAFALLWSLLKKSW